MSDDKLPKKADDTLPAVAHTDITAEDMKLVEAYAAEGMPELMTVTEEKLKRAETLYLRGKSYVNVARTLRIRKDAILFLAHKYDWYTKKRVHLHTLASESIEKSADALLQVRETLRDLLLQQNDIVKDHMEYFDNTSDRITKEELDKKHTPLFSKLLDQFVDIEKDVKSSHPKAPAVTVNIGQGATVKQNSDNTMEITPKESRGAAIERMAEEERQEEKRKKNEKLIDASDIKEDNE